MKRIKQHYGDHIIYIAPMEEEIEVTGGKENVIIKTGIIGIEEAIRVAKRNIDEETNREQLPLGHKVLL